MAPTIIPATSGKGLTVIGSEVKAPSPHAFTPLTVILPEVAVGPKFTVILFVLLVPVAPMGKVQLYVEALGIKGSEYVTAF